MKNSANFILDNQTVVNSQVRAKKELSEKQIAFLYKILSVWCFKTTGKPVQKSGLGGMYSTSYWDVPLNQIIGIIRNGKPINNRQHFVVQYVDYVDYDEAQKIMQFYQSDKFEEFAKQNQKVSVNQ